MKSEPVYARLHAHIHAFFSGHETTRLTWKKGPIGDVLPEFHVLRVAPGPKTNLWTYVSIGAWEVDRDTSGGLEFFVVGNEENERYVEALAMTAFYHQAHHLGKSHTFPIGEPWWPDSPLDHLLLSLPYIFGPEFEVCSLPDRHIHFLWLLPITQAEREFKAANGLDALEERFEQSGIEYWNPLRTSLV